jgi:hypothetical protein
MAKILGKSVQCLVAKNTAGGVRYYWQPSAALAKAGWKSLSLGQDLVRAIAAAEAENERVSEWRTGGAKPKQVKKFIQRATVAALVQSYRASEKFTTLAPNTKNTYSTALNLIERWATDKAPGDIAAALITPARVKVLRNALMKPTSVKDTPKARACKGHVPSDDPEICDACGEPIKVQHHRAHNILRVGRTLFAYGKRNVDGITENPFEAFDLSTPDPRFQIWEPTHVAAFSAAAIALDYPSMAFAVELAEYTGQREADLIAATKGNLGPVNGLDEGQIQKLGDAVGSVTGLYFKQQKTRVPVVVPLDPRMLARIQAAIAANQKRPVPSSHILVSDFVGTPWTKRPFIAKFNEIRAWAIDPPAEARAAGIEPCPELADLQFRDLRRTCIVRLGELGLMDGQISAISGHRLASIKRILETYMPRTPKMSASAVVARLDYAAVRTKAAEKRA